ncbi:ABC transporter permease [Pseudomonas sp. MAG002Y]|uniref:ABC transporter permease n=1 Tax=Pseudomonas sp. MAG002Y TaxID=2678690 RepID=UPI001C60B4EC|nr:ABC transporter permease [Pseudomonas sp. MAG002Y]MBW5413101.1 ABC transporter permease [Pseudomonas sp. MAG002Y]
MNLSLIFNFTRQDLIDRHSASVLGAAWTFILPLVNILIFTLVFSNIMGMRLDTLGMQQLGQYSYSIYLVTGVLAWNCFSSTLTRITQVFHEKAHLIGKVKISLWSLPLYILLSETILYAISMAFFVAFLIIIGFHFPKSVLYWPIIFICQQLLAYAAGLAFAVLSVFLRDVGQIVGVVMQLWFWLTPIVYVLNILPERWHTLFVFNPFYHIVEAYRAVLIQGVSPDIQALCVLFIIGFVLLGFSIFVGRKLERDIRDFL